QRVIGKPDGKTPLTVREREVLERVASGSSNRQIAEDCGISENTVKNHLKNILQKLHLDNRVQLTRYAMEKGLLPRSGDVMD
ncbi:response regulator transcription factor, partial [Paenibacillus sepulcri]|nr:response regulator transcription factor [Paenibacillus sepulcri]